MTCPFLICFKEIRSMLLNGVKRIFNALLLLKKTKEIVLWTFQYKYYNYCYLLCTTCTPAMVRISVRVVVFDATYNISVISWRSVLLVKETWLPDGNHGPTASHWQTLSHNVVSSTPRRTHNVSGDRHWLHR